jgi:hypothetical protein
MDIKEKGRQLKELEESIMRIDGLCIKLTERFDGVSIEMAEEWLKEIGRLDPRFLLDTYGLRSNEHIKIVEVIRAHLEQSVGREFPAVMKIPPAFYIRKPNTPDDLPSWPRVALNAIVRREMEPEKKLELMQRLEKVVRSMFRRPGRPSLERASVPGKAGEIQIREGRHGESSLQFADRIVRCAPLYARLFQTLGRAMECQAEAGGGLLSVKLKTVVKGIYGKNAQPHYDKLKKDPRHLAPIISKANTLLKAVAVIPSINPEYKRHKIVYFRGEEKFTWRIPPGLNRITVNGSGPQP